MSSVRTRFAPSPTGALHAGTVRTALFAWLVARHDNGQFILRIEDTDQARSVEGAVDNIKDSLTYVGINWDEGPFFQSERLDIYKQWAQKLIESGRAYADPYSQQELNDLRQKAKDAHKPFLFRDCRPDNPPVWQEGMPLRFKSEPKTYAWVDSVLGELNSSEEAIDDFILIKSDGWPTYNFAHIVDDQLMEITHVIRSQEFTSSVPKFLNLYEALNIEHPIFATLPQVLNDSGQRKLSKREGAKQIIDYKQVGVLSDALMNYLATLGWNDGTTKEVFSESELIETFSLSRVQKSGAQFSEQALFFMNGVYIRGKSLDELFDLSREFWPAKASDFDENYKKDVLGLIQERLKYLSEIPELTNFFFEDLPLNPELIKSHKYLSKMPNDELKDMLIKSREVLSSTTEEDYNPTKLQGELNKLLETTDQKPVILFSLIRIATTQAAASPGLAETLAVLGRERVVRRIDQQINSL